MWFRRPCFRRHISNATYSIEMSFCSTAVGASSHSGFISVVNFDVGISADSCAVRKRETRSGDYEFVRCVDRARLVEPRLVHLRQDPVLCRWLRWVDGVDGSVGVGDLGTGFACDDDSDCHVPG